MAPQAGGLTRRMVLASGALALVIGAAFAVLLSSVEDLRGLQQQARQSQEVLVAASRLERLVVDAQNLPAAREAFPAQAAELRRLVAGDPRRVAQVDRITADGSAYLRGGPATAVTAFRAEVDDLIGAERALATARQRHAEAIDGRATLGAGVGLAASVLLVAGFAAYLNRVIVSPVRRIAALTGRLAGGDLGARLPETGFGEIGVLQRGFNGMAGALQQGRDDLAASRARIVTAADQARRRIERDLHDGIQQRLVSLMLELRAAEAAVPHDRPELRADLDAVVAGLDGALDELREVARGIHPANLSEGGLRPALRALARRSAVPVELDVQVPTRPPEAVEVAAYYVVSEALTNAAKHADASVVQVQVCATDDALRLLIVDDGAGGAEPTAAGGLIGLVDRIQALGGTMTITSSPGAGTTLEATLPTFHAEVPGPSRARP